ALCEFFYCRQATNEIFEFRKMCLQLWPQAGGALGAEKSSRSVKVPLAKGTEQLKAGLAVAGRRGLPHRNQLVGDLGHGADDHNGFLGAAAGDDFRNALDCLRAFDRRTAKFHHDHADTFQGILFQTSRICHINERPTALFGCGSRAEVLIPAQRPRQTVIRVPVVVWDMRVWSVDVMNYLIYMAR